ncbi:hypothetical protein O6H91_Y272500 [Diphasiastrum complanatum]|nr:hypothetical protein O6H91_Y272500 [Diphasiastrum complanatum]
MGMPVSTPRLMIVSDLDNTMVDHQDSSNGSLLRFDALWAADYTHDSLLVFSTGRSPTLYKELRNQKPLLTPGIAIMSVGTEIMYGDSMTPDLGWEQELNQGWDRDIVVHEASSFSQLRPQAETEQRPHKVSFNIEKAQATQVIESLSEKLQARGLKVKLIYSGSIDLDVLPEGAGKGQALAYLLRKFRSEGKSPFKTLVCGDSGNDAELFSVADVHGVIVGNAQEELLEWHAKNAKDNPKIFKATERCAAGIIQALQHFDFRPNISPRDYVGLNSRQSPATGYFAVGHEIVEYYLLFEKWFRGEVENSEEIFQHLKHSLSTDSIVIHPWGVEESAHRRLEDVRSLYGSQSGKTFAIWVDRIRFTTIGEHSWIANFDAWQRTETELCCRLTTAILQSQVDRPHGLQWLQIHETWLKGYAGQPTL